MDGLRPRAELLHELLDVLGVKALEEASESAEFAGKETLETIEALRKVEFVFESLQELFDALRVVQGRQQSFELWSTCGFDLLSCGFELARLGFPVVQRDWSAQRFDGRFTCRAHTFDI